MTNPARAKEMLAEANSNLDQLGNALAAGHNAAPDLVMRFAMATRQRLERHWARTEGVWPRERAVCTYCNADWPCPDVVGDFAAIGPDLNSEDGD